MYKVKTKPTGKPKEISPIDLKISDGMTRIFGVREEIQTTSNKEFEQLLNQMMKNE